MTLRDLDRLVSQTDLNPVNKRALRIVRRQVLSGRATDPKVHRYDWTIEVENGMRLKFSLRKAKHGDDAQD